MDGFVRRSWLNVLRGYKVTDTATGDRVTEMQRWSAVKSPLGAQTVLGDRHDPIYEICLQIPSAACGTRPRELSSGLARKQIRATDTDTDTATDTDINTATELHKCAAVKSPLGAQTVLGDRHDPVERSLIASHVGRLRNSPERTFQRLGTQTDLRRI